MLSSSSLIIVVWGRHKFSGSFLSRFPFCFSLRACHGAQIIIGLWRIATSRSYYQTPPSGDVEMFT